MAHHFSPDRFSVPRWAALLALLPALAACSSSASVGTNPTTTGTGSSTSASAASSTASSGSASSSGSTASSGSSGGSSSGATSGSTGSTGTGSSSGSSSAGASTTGSVDAGMLCTDCRLGCACPGIQPQCDRQTGQCVQCLSNGDCRLDAGVNPRTPVCNAALGACAECAADTDCLRPGAPHCGALGRCVECKSDTQCSGTLTTCETDQKSRFYGRCEQCSSHSGTACTLPQLCDPTLDQCVTNCDTQAGVSACSDFQLGCNFTEGLCPSGCLSSEDCGGQTSPLCDPDAHSCLSCLTDSNCTGSYKDHCETNPTAQQFGSCVQCTLGAWSECNSDAGFQCEPGPVPGTGGVCVQDCRLTTVGNACVFPRNGPLCNPATGACVQCLSDTDCPSTARVCDPATNLCVPCRGPQDCPYSSPACYSASQVPTCNGLTCQFDLQCPPNQQCVGSPGFASQCQCRDDRGCGGNAPFCEDPTSGSEWNSSAGFGGVCGCLVDGGACPEGTYCDMSTVVGACLLLDGGGAVLP